MLLLLQEKNFAAAFAHFDRDGSGSLTTDEICEALASLGVTDDEVHVGSHAARCMQHAGCRFMNGLLYMPLLHLVNNGLYGCALAHIVLPT